jgi:hypothetical protein
LKFRFLSIEEKAMDQRIARLAKKMGAKHVGTLPNVGGGAFGMARLAQLLHARLAPSSGKRPGRPTNDEWTEHPKVPMSSETLASLRELSDRLSNDERKVSPMQLAAQLLEESVLQIAHTGSKRSRRANRGG